MKADLPLAARVALRASLLSLALACAGPALAQHTGPGEWASETDPLAIQLIEQERKWATLACSPSLDMAAQSAGFIDELIADDFVGTSPTGRIYTKSDMLTMPESWEPELDCKLIGARVRFIGSDLAIVYGSESASVKGADGTFAPRGLTWTDTFLKRGGKWQIVAVQDMVTPGE